MGTWKSKNRHKYLLQYHIIFVCKYRKKLLISKQISDDIKQFSYEICQRHKVIIRYSETDKGQSYSLHDRETEPTNVSESNRKFNEKLYDIPYMGKIFKLFAKTVFEKACTFWTYGYFACSVGNVSEEMLKKSVVNQG